MSRYLIWDFDGTLGFRVGGWTSALVDVLRKKAPECRATADDLRPHIQTGYPWHAPEQGYAIRTAEQWWEDLAPVFERAFTAVGIETSLAKIFAREVQGVYANPDCFELYEDTLPTLNQLSGQGWVHMILSNHIPELGEIVSHLGLSPLMNRVFNSAEMGYEKPHPLAFRDVVNLTKGADAVWMIGDSLAADVKGAEAVGIPAILVRQYRPKRRGFALIWRAFLFCWNRLGKFTMKPDLSPFLGRHVTIVIDRPLGSQHPRHPDIIYPINYGFVPGTISGDGMAVDAYIIGLDTPVDKVEGIIIAVIIRADDAEDKLVASVGDKQYTAEQIMEQVRFQERFFDSHIVMLRIA